MNHVETNGEESWYTCNKCEYKTSHNVIVKKHLETTYKDSCYPCNQCEYKVTHKFSNFQIVSGSQLLFDFQTFLAVNRRNEFFIFSKQSVQYRKKHIMWHFSKLKKAKLISVFNLVFLSLSDRNKSLFSFSPVRDNLLLV